MSSRGVFILLWAVFLPIAAGAVQDSSDSAAAGMAEGELQGLFEVMTALLEDSSWAELHPHPCTDTPWPGIQCELSQAGKESELYLHVTRLHIGPDVAAPPCRGGAVFPAASLLQLPYLKSLSLIGCFIETPVSPLVNLSAALFTTSSVLEQLVMKSNPGLSGEIPGTIVLLSRLRVLTLSQSRLHGAIPRELGGGGGLSKLEELDLSYNQLSGRIPEDMSGLASLSILDLSWNSLKGPLPPSLGKLAALQKMDLSSNLLSGSIPREMSSLNRLLLLDLSANSLSGTIPATFKALNGSLEYLLLEGNPLNGVIPATLGELRKLAVLSLSGCGMWGPIPSSLTRLSRLTALSLDGNRLNGTVPPELGLLPSLRQLNLSHNELSGEVPFVEQFVARLGARLDVRGNRGLCTDPAAFRRNIYLMGSIGPPCTYASAAASARPGLEPPPAGEPQAVGASKSSSWSDGDEEELRRSSAGATTATSPAFSAIAAGCCCCFLHLLLFLLAVV
ncbi:unnamed protein product [Spirodela intermedia]|uniref:Uncharacterized protein n=1 Tax=Spirodela intermedia TaxID=51605 RepID=A0A7I8K8E0_SPIIN|nr:unnamed protein product [Spirodela intermedia]